MRRSTTSAATKRLLLGVLFAELILAAALVGRQPAAPHPSPPTAAPAVLTAPATSTTQTSPCPSGGRCPQPDGRSVQLVGLGGQRTAALLARIAGQIGDAAEAVTAFWGADWPRHIVIAAAASDEQFRALAGGGADIAAATTSWIAGSAGAGQRIIFAPGASAMTDAALRIVLRHELFHYAARAATAADAPRWLTEGVADFVARPPAAPPGPTQAGALAQLPTDADLDAIGPARSLAYDRAWWFSRFVADRYGTAALRALYLRACGAGHPDAATAVRDALGDDLHDVVTGWRHWLAG